MDRSDPGTFSAAAIFLHIVLECERPDTLGAASDDTGLRHLMRHDNVPLSARAVSSFRVAAGDDPERLFAGAGAGAGAGCGGLRAGDIDVLDGERPGFGTSDRKLPGVFRALGRRSFGGRISFCWANDGRTLLVAGDVASQPRRALVPFGTMNDPSGKITVGRTLIA